MKPKTVHIAAYIDSDLRASVEALSERQARRPVDLLREEIYRTEILDDEPQSPGPTMIKFRVTEEQKKLIEQLAIKSKTNFSEAVRRLLANVVKRYGGAA
jgi:hypothetical protein